MRFLLEIAGCFVDLSTGRSELEPERTPEPPQGATCGALERVPSWDQDQRSPLGFAARTEGKRRCQPL